jgi:hypothetical protein
VLFVLWHSIRFWRRPDTANAKPPEIWVWGDALWSGLVRANLALALTMLTVITLVLYIALVGGGRNVRNDVSLGLLGLFLLGIAVCVTIAFWNQPKFLVPPYLRGEDGAIALWRGRRGRRSR